MRYKTQECYQICEGPASTMPMLPTKCTKNISTVHEVNINKTQLLSMSCNRVRHKKPFCITDYQASLISGISGAIPEFPEINIKIVPKIRKFVACAGRFGFDLIHSNAFEKLM